MEKGLMDYNTEYRKSENCIGKVIGELTILEELEPHITPNGSKQRIVRCQCSCGNVYISRLTTAQNSKKCRKCLNADRRINLTGHRFGRLVVKSMSQDYISPAGNRLSRCTCHCDCGKDITVNMSALITGSTRSCGCISNTQGLLCDNEELVSKYDFEKNNDVDFYSLKARSSKKVWWKCYACNNSWYATIASQNDKIKHGCPYCSGRMVVKGKNDLLSRYPSVVREWWDYEKNTVEPDEISIASSKKIWWICKEGHSWKAKVANKVRGSGCPKCNVEKVNSFCEQSVFYYIKQAFADAVNGDNHIGMELDVYIPSLRVAIEYDGEAWHNTQKKYVFDQRKNELCKNNGIKIIRIREPKLEPIDNCINIVRDDSTSNQSLDLAITKVLGIIGINDVEVDTERDTTSILEQYATKKENNSLLRVYPDIATEWHHEKNGNLTPDKVSKASGYKVWWLGKCGHEWKMSVCGRTVQRVRKDGTILKPYGCPYCSGKRLLVGFNDLKSQFPKLASEWNYDRNNGLMPEGIMGNSNKKVWWKCNKGHEWQSSPNNRNTNSGRCPICYRSERSPEVLCVETGVVFENSRDAAKAYGIKSSGSIYSCCRGDAKTAGGYHWKYHISTDDSR